ncbi:MAG TPA: branched-chain amino acid ABC transporter permease [Firmicutes bacterium]|nr:branched-chain amino acid ABC transporter permease [Bacillota bacterium]
MSVGQLAQQLANGIVIGGIYALSAVGLTMIYGMMNIVNVAHGELFMLGALLTYYLTQAVGLSFFVGVAASILLVSALGMVIERAALRPIRNSPMVVTTLATLGISLMLQNLCLIITSGIPRFIGSPFSDIPLSVAGITLAPARLFATVVAVAVIVGTHVFLHRSKLGNAMRAAFQDKEASSLAGINVSSIYMLTYALGAGLAALAGALLGTVAYVDPMMGAKGLMKCFVVVTIGGMGDFLGAIFAGFLLGVVETLSAAYISSMYKDVIGFVMVIVVLLFLPSGLFGRKERF